MFKIIVHSVKGEEELPGWPDIANFFGDLLKPFCYFILTIIISFLPAIIYYYYSKNTSFTDPVFLLTTILGILYVPMGLIAVAMFNSLMVLSPHIILPSIKRILSDYLVACLFLVVILAFEQIGKAVISKVNIPILGIPIYSFLILYFIAVEMRILGLIYYTNRRRLGWLQDDF